MQEYQVEVVVEMQVVIKVQAEDSYEAQRIAGIIIKANPAEGKTTDITITDTYIIE